MKQFENSEYFQKNKDTILPESVKILKKYPNLNHLRNVFNFIFEYCEYDNMAFDIKDIEITVEEKMEKHKKYGNGCTEKDYPEYIFKYCNEFISILNDNDNKYCLSEIEYSFITLSKEQLIEKINEIRHLTNKMMELIDKSIKNYDLEKNIQIINVNILEKINSIIFAFPNDPPRKLTNDELINMYKEIEEDRKYYKGIFKDLNKNNP